MTQLLTLLQVTCGVSVAALDRGVLEQLDKTLRRDGVKARLITSGTGDWRFLDIVPLTAVSPAGSTS